MQCTDHSVIIRVIRMLRIINVYNGDPEIPIISRSQKVEIEIYTPKSTSAYESETFSINRRL